MRELADVMEGQNVIHVSRRAKLSIEKVAKVTPKRIHIGPAGIWIFKRSTGYPDNRSGSPGEGFIRLPKNGEVFELRREQQLAYERRLRMEQDAHQREVEVLEWLVDFVKGRASRDQVRELIRDAANVEGLIALKERFDR